LPKRKAHLKGSLQALLGLIRVKLLIASRASRPGSPLGDMLTMHPEARRRVVQVFGELEALQLVVSRGFGESGRGWLVRGRLLLRMRPLRYSINVTLDGFYDYRAIPADEDLHRHAVENLNQADALLFGRVTYEMMGSAWRPPVPTGARPDWMEPFAQTINAAKKYVVSSTLKQVDWNSEIVRGDLGKAVQQLKRESGRGLSWEV
jgi:hypothetical protein